VTLSALLDELVVEHDRIGSPLRARLGPGRSRAEIEAALQGLGLAAPHEVVELFAWREIRDAPGDQSRVEWFWPAAPLRLDEALRSYRDMIQAGDGALTRAEVDELVRTFDPRNTFTGFWRDDWFPILYGTPEQYAVECGTAAGGEAASPVWRVNWHPDTGFPTMQLAPSLTAFVARVVELFRLGAYAWSEQYQSVTTIDEVFERLGLGYDVRPWPSAPE
jgi:hypothetical protein